MLRDTPKADPSDFDILIRVADTGKPLHILIAPETNVAKCLRGSIEAAKYPAPPRPRYWVDVEMHIKP